MAFREQPLLELAKTQHQEFARLLQDWMGARDEVQPQELAHETPWPGNTLGSTLTASSGRCGAEVCRRCSLQLGSSGFIFSSQQDLIEDKQEKMQTDLFKAP